MLLAPRRPPPRAPSAPRRRCAVARAPRAAAAEPHPLPPGLALKEWGVLVSALAAGDATLLVRRGGLRDPGAGFDLAASRFLLLPTTFHAAAAAVDPALAAAHAAALAPRDPAAAGPLITHAAEVTGAWQTSGADAAAVAAALGPFHRLSADGVHSRARGAAALTLLEVRVHALKQPLPLTPADAAAVAGCTAWARLPASVPAPPPAWAAAPALDDDAFAARAVALRAALRTKLAPAELDVGSLGSRDD